MNVDDLFKTQKLPAGRNKRKLPDAPTPEMLKKLRSDEEATSVTGVNGSSTSKGKQRAVTVEDVADEDGGPNDFAPGGDADYFAEEDEDGRFYGGGLTSEQKDILNIFEQAGGEGVQEGMEELSITGIRRTLLKLQRAVNKNQDMRSKYPDDPTKFIDSEADLDSALKSLLPLSQVPTLAYPEIARSDAIGLLIGLLAHENVDIVIDVVEVIHELTDEDVGDEDDEDAEEDNNAALKVLIDGLLENSILDLLVDNLSRLNETEESDRLGVFHILGFFENVLGFDPQLSVQLVSKTKILPWLLKRIQSSTHEENRGYAAEVLSILLQNDPANRLEVGRLNGIEHLLTVLSRFRNKDPSDADEIEFMDNIFNALCSALSEPSNKKLFVESEGPELMAIMMKAKVESSARAVKTLDYAMSGPSGSAACTVFVEAAGLKPLFQHLLGTVTKKQKAKDAQPASEETSHVLGIISSLFTHIASESVERIRLLTKFVEKNYEKVDKLLDIRDAAKSRLKATEKQIDTEKQELLASGEEIDQDQESLWYLSRLDGGLFTLQTVDYILAWIIMEDDGIQTHALQMLRRKSEGLDDIVKTLRIYYDNVDQDENLPEDSVSQRDILQGLIQALEPSDPDAMQT